ncbi:MAG: ABC transporter permease [Deltaproteobacteria bacterium]|nr:ABC transporter permease [Deltaproteobacteria bacterium]MBL7075339.1 ABC transporter permease [candidate division KSB1 bacterium]
MISYLVMRFGYYLSIFLGIIVFSFLLFHVIPSDPARTILGPNADQAQVEQLREKLGLNEPLYRRLGYYLVNVATLKFGHSYVDGRDVFIEIGRRFKVTLSLITVSMVIVFGYLAVTILTFRFSSLQRWSHAIDFLISSLPVFFSGIIGAIFVLYFYPVTSFSGNLNSVNDLIFLIPPALVLAFYPMSILSGILKEEMSFVLQSLYITAEKSWGFSDITILFKYALKNSLIPILSALSNILPMLLTGAFIVEIIFSVPGIGSILVKSILEQDFPMLECTVIVNGAFFVLVNLGFEYLYPLLDPRTVRGNKI